MDFTLSDERRMLKETADRYLADHYPIEARHKAAATERGYDPAQWKQMADLGLIGALFPPEVGGYGGTGEDIALVFESLGRALVVEPFLATLMGGTALMLAGHDRDDMIAYVIQEGETNLAFAHGERNSRYSLTHVETTATRGYYSDLTGHKSVVLNGASASYIVISAQWGGRPSDAGSLGLYLTSPNSKGVTIRDYDTIEGGRACEMTLDSVGCDIETTAAFPIIEATIARGTLALCAEALGIMDVCKDMTLDYLKTRTQFGRPIGKFQVIQHRMVDIVLEIEQARSAVMLAAANMDGPRLERERTVSAAKNLIGRVGRLVAEESIQLHGGIAMTWDYALPHYAKRLVMIDHLLGDTDHHLTRFQNLSRESAI